MSRRPAHLLLLSTAALLLNATAAEAQSPSELIPFERLPAELRKEVWRVTRAPTLRRKVPERVVPCAPASYGWILRHLPFAATALRSMKIADYAIAKIGPDSVSVDDRSGAFARCQTVFEEPSRRVLFAKGHIRAPLLPKVEGRAVIVIRYWATPGTAEGSSAPTARTTSDCRIYFRLDDGFLHRVSRPLRAIMGKVMQKKLDALVGCAASFAERLETQPDRVLRAVKRARPPVAAEDLESFEARFTKRALPEQP